MRSPPHLSLSLSLSPTTSQTYIGITWIGLFIFFILKKGRWGLEGPEIASFTSQRRPSYATTRRRSSKREVRQEDVRLLESEVLLHMLSKAWHAANMFNWHENLNGSDFWVIFLAFSFQRRQRKQKEAEMKSLMKRWWQQRNQEKQDNDDEKDRSTDITKERERERERQSKGIKVSINVTLEASRFLCHSEWTWRGILCTVQAVQKYQNFKCHERVNSNMGKRVDENWKNEYEVSLSFANIRLHTWITE